jgi:hypothetical protein
MQGGQISDHGVKQGLKDARGRSHLQSAIDQAGVQIGCDPFTATAILPLNALSPATLEVEGPELASIGDAGKALGGLGGR